MRNIWLIARREYLERVRTRSFMIMTVLTPLLMAGLTIGPGLLAARVSHTSRHIVVVASDQQTGDTIREQLIHENDESRQSEEAARKTSMRRGPQPQPEIMVDVETNVSAEHRDR